MQDRAPVLAYVRPIEPVDDDELMLDASIQRTAIRACARGEDLGSPEVFEEAAREGCFAFLLLVDEQDGGVPRPVIVTTMQVLGDTALVRARRLLLLERVSQRVYFADGQLPEDALRQDWEGRPEDERRRDRARDAMRAKALRGLVLGRPPYGYVVEEQSLAPHPRESKVVQRMFREYLEAGEGLRRIAAGLNRDGLRTRRGGLWSPGSVRTVLRNPTYTGLYRRLGVVVPAAHPALIDRATFGATQRRMTEKRTARTDQERHEYPLAGLLRCGQCGGSMTGQRRQATSGVAVSYRCESATARGTCKARARSAEVLEASIREELARSERQHAAAYPVAARQTETPDPDARRHRLERRLAVAIERWAAGEWRYHELVARSAPLVRDLNELDRPADPSRPTAEEARRQLVEYWDDLDDRERSALLRTAIAEAVVLDDDVRVTRRR